MKLGMLVFFACFLFLLCLAFGMLRFFSSRPQLGEVYSIEELRERYGQYSYFQDASFKPFHVDAALTFKKFLLYVEGLLKKKNARPKKIIENLPLKFENAPQNEVKATWFGHSSLLFQFGSLKVLVDPVFSGYASPFSFFGKQFAYRSSYDAKNFPKIDVLIISHNHYDHLDYETLSHLKDKVDLVATSLGVSKCLLSWGFDQEKIVELAWDESFRRGELDITAVTAKHFSGRTLKDQNATLWSGWVLSWKGKKIYYSGDSSYDSFFKEIGEKYGPIDLAAIECGAYDKLWPDVHMFPEQTVQAAQDVKAKMLLPIHWGKFDLALHSWDDSIERVVAEAQKRGLPITTPRIGQTIGLDETVEDPWWREAL